MPYAWRRTANFDLYPKPCGKTTQTEVKNHVEMDELHQSKLFQKISKSLTPDMFSDAGLKLMLHEAESIGCIDFRLPSNKNATAGGVLRHCSTVAEDLFDKWTPLIFKFGYTHNPVWRWSNKMYGYSRCTDRWSNMVVMYITTEPRGPAMLEAALIEKYQSIWAASYPATDIPKVLFVYSSFLFVYSLP